MPTASMWWKTARRWNPDDMRTCCGKDGRYAAFYRLQLKEQERTQPAAAIATGN